MGERNNEDLVSREQNAMPPQKKKKAFKRAFVTLLLVLVVMIAAVAIAVHSVPRAIIDSNIQHTSELSESEVAVTPDLPPAQEVHNIALFGIDQASGSVGRSDAMIVLSIDKANNKIKMTSLSRDSLVPIDGHGQEKLTHAWAHGHAKLAIKTINQNFGMNITDYVYVNFKEFRSVIDYLGGVYLDVSAAEMKTLNNYYDTWVEQYGADVSKITQAGRQLLNGGQALSYARNRTDGGDSTRTDRQREVLTAMYQRVKEQPLSKLPGTLTQALRLCHTNMDSDELLDIATWAVTNSPEITSMHMPNEELEVWNGILDKERGWVRVYDLDAAKNVLHNFIYETDLPVYTVPETVSDATEE